MSAPKIWCVTLAKRHHGAHRAVAHVYFPCNHDLVTWADDPVRGRVPIVDEDELLRWMPPAMIPRGTPVSRVLLLADEEGHGSGSTAVGTPKRFRAWGKYFDAYSIAVRRVDAMPAGAIPAAIREGWPQRPTITARSQGEEG